MSPAIVFPAIAAFLSGTVTAVFVILVAAIRASDRRPLTTAPDGRIEALTRNLLGVGVRTSRRASSGDSGKR
jgi:hypothetical protein